MSENIRQKLKHERPSGDSFEKYFKILIIILSVLVFFYNSAKLFLERLVQKFAGVEKPVDKETVLITGTGHGIGKELALQYAALGATVICWDINKETNDETVEEIRKNGQKAYGYVCDVSNREQIAQIAEKVREDVGDITVLVNNAGIMPARLITEQTEEEIRKTFDVCLFSQFWTIKEFIPDMIKKKHGHVVNVSSVLGLMPIKNLTAYCSAKYGVRGLSEALSEEFRRGYLNSDLHVTCVYPVMVDTGLIKNKRIKYEGCPVFELKQPKYVASEIIKAMRMNYREKTIPGYYLPFMNLVRNLPEQLQGLLVDFIDINIDSD